MNFIWDFGHGALRAYVYPTRGKRGPYRMEVTRENGSGWTFAGLPTVERCVESAVSVMRLAGSRIPRGAIFEWTQKAAAIDRQAEAEMRPVLS